MAPRHEGDTEERLRDALLDSREALNHRRDAETNRKLTDDDVEAIVVLLQKRMAEQFYQDVGKGVWATAKKGFVIALILLAIYGYLNGHLPSSK